MGTEEKKPNVYKKGNKDKVARIDNPRLLNNPRWREKNGWVLIEEPKVGKVFSPKPLKIDESFDGIPDISEPEINEEPKAIVKKPAPVKKPGLRKKTAQNKQ